MRAALFANRNKKKSLEIAQEIFFFLKKNGVDVVARDDEASEIGVPPLSSVSMNDIDIIISLGGDGTILRLVHQFPDFNKPILGVNLGHLGFMADVPLIDLYPSLEDLLKGRYIVENRIMMEGRTPSGELLFGVNEMVVHRSSNPSLVEIAIYIDGTYLNTFSADGVIISTPSGSTAYSLAAGGPILSPELDAFVITPISPHTISNRAIVLMPKESIEVQYLSDNQPVEITFDGISCYHLKTNERFSVCRSPKKFQLISLLRRNYFSTLRTKLGWAGKMPLSND